MKNITSSFLKSALFALLFFSSLNVALADGSKDMYPADYDGTYRARLFATRYGNGDGTYNFPFVTYGTMKVYAKEGEHIYLAASNMKSGANGRIDWRSPDGKSGSFSSNSSSQGYIANRTKELAGPNLQNNSTGDGYNAFVLTVGAGQEGVWEIDFRSTTNNSETYKTNEASCKVESWDDGTSYWLISAFDASVSNVADDEFIHGRVYTNVLNLNMADGAKDWKPTFYVLTNTGYLYEVNPNGLAGHNFTFFANNKGVQTNVHGTLDKSNYGYPAGFAGQYGGVPAYGSVDPNKESPYPVYDPRLPDRVTKRMIDGVEVDCSDITHKIFFCKPAADMPESVEHCVYGTTIQPTWLVSKENAKDAPILSNLCIAGKESHLPGVMGPEGVEVYFEANSAGEYVIELDFKDSRYENITFSGTCEEGVNTIDWDGKDNKGVLVEDATVSLSGQLKSAEIHFPFIDIESNVYGFYLKQFNAEWTAISRDVMYWDDSNVTSTKDAGDDDIKKLAGQASPGHKFVDRGDNIILDTWTYASGVSAGAQNQVVHANYIDLKVNSITCDKTVAHIGEEITYTVEVQNVKGTNVLLHSAGVYVDTKANADSASVGVWFPNGGFNTTSVTLVSSTDDDCSVIQQPSGEEYGLGFITLKNGHSATVEVKGYANSKLAHSAVSPVGFIMRPGDYYEVDANNINDDGMPLVPQKTTSGSEKGEYDTEWENNNLTTSNPTIFFLNSAPEAENDVLKVAKGEVTTGTIAVGPLANDTDVDADVLIITEVYYMDGATKKTITLGSSHTIKVGGTTYGTITIYADGHYSANISVENPPVLHYAISDQFEGVSSLVIPDYEEKYKDLDLIPGVADATITLQIDHAPTISPTSMSICLSKTAQNIHNDQTESQVLPIVIEDIDGDAITSVTFAQSGSTNYAGNFSYSNGEITFTAKKNCITRSGTKGSYTYSYNTITVKVTVVTATLSSEQVITLTLENGTPTEVTGFAVSGSTVEYGTTVADAVSVTLPSVSGSYSIKEGTASVYDETILPVGTHTLSYMYVPSGETCYTPSTKTAIVKVTPKTITPSATGVDKEYDGTTTATVTSVTGSGILTGDNVTVTATSAVFANANVGTNKTVTVTYSLSGTDASNYVLSSTTGTTTADITAKDVTITVDDKEKVYGATNPTFTGSVSGLINDGDLGTISYSRISTNENAGTYTDDLTASFTANTNYNVSVTKGTFTIKPITDEITVTITGNSDATKVYTGSEQSVTGFDYDNKDKCTVALKTGEKAEAKGTNAGTYPMGLTESMFDVTSTNYSNIKVVIVDGTMTIGKDATELTVTITGNSDATKVYTGSEQSVTGFDYDNKDKCTVALKTGEKAEAKGTNAGTYTMGLTESMFDVTSTNYSNIKVVVEDGSMTIGKDATELTVTITGNSDATKVYTGSEQSVTGFDYDNKDKCTVALKTGEKAEAKGTNAGTYTMGLTESMFDVTSTNYSNIKVVIVDGSMTISPATITVTSVTAEDKEYDATTDAEISSVVFSGVQNSEATSVINVTATGSFENANVGTDKTVAIASYTLTGTGKDNYQLATGAPESTTADITAKEVVLDWGTTSFKYDGTEKTVTATVTNAVNSDVVTVTTYTGNKQTVAGSDYVAEATALDNTNYVLPSNATTSWEITKNDTELTVTITGNSDLTKVYTGSEQSVTGFDYDNKDKCTVALKTGEKAEAKGTNAGTYTMGLTESMFDVTSTNYSNIKVVVEDGSMTINPATITVTTPTVKDKDYDATKTAEINGNLSFSGVQNSEGTSVINVTAVAEFEDANVGTDKDVTVSYTLEGTGKDNYVLASETATTAADIAALTIIPSATGENKTYDGTTTATVTSVSGSGILTGDDVTVTATSANFGDANVGTGKTVTVVYSLSGTAASNYVLGTPTATTANITALTIIPSATGVDKEYDGTTTATVTSVTGSGIVDGDNVIVSASSATFANADAGTDKAVTVTYSLSGTDAGNYVLGTPTATTADITAKEVGLTWSTPASFEYDAASHSVTATVTGLVSPDVCTVTSYTNNEKTEVGEYTASATALSNANYTLPSSATYAWEITTQTAETDDQDVTLSEGGSEVDDETYTYDGTEKKPTVVVKDKDGNVIPETEYTVTYDDNTEAGTGKVIIKDKEGGNYVVEDNEIEFKINPKEVGLTWSTPASFEYDAASHSVTATVTGLVSPDVCTVTSYTNNEKTEVGEYTASATALSNANYTLPSSATYAWEITMQTAETDDQDVTLSEGGSEVDDETYTYDGTEKKPTVVVKDKDGNVIPETEYTVTYDDNTEAGTGKVIIKDKEGGNYVVEDNEIEFKINPKEVGLTWSTPASFEYDAASHSVTATVTGLVSSDVCTVTSYTNNEKTEVGEYTASATALSNANYTLPSSATYAWEITVQTAETDDQDVTLSEGGSEVDDETYTYDGTEKKPTVVVKDKDGNVIPETEYTVTYDDNTEAGTAKVIIKDKEGGNYVVEDNEIEFVINKAPITVTTPIVSDKTYDGSTTGAIDGDIEFTGVQNSEGTSVINVTAVAEFDDATAGTAKDVTVTYTLEGTGASNYVLVSASDVTLADIDPKEVTINWGTTTFEYDGESKEVTASIGDVVEGDNCTISLAGNVETEVGSYTAVPSLTGDDAANYVLPADPNKSWTISMDVLHKEEQTITLTEAGSEVTDETYTYDGTPKTPTVVVTDDKGNIVPDTEYTVTYEENTDAGTATVTITNKEGGNYTIEENSVTYKINPAVITVTEASVTEKTYDGTDEAEVTVSAFTGKVGSDDVTVTATGTFEDANAGTDKDVTVEYTLSGDGASNYVLIVDTDTKQGTIGQKEVTLDWSDVLEFEYDGESHGVTVEVTGLVGDDECDATVTNNTGVDAQSYTAEVTALSNDNYKLPAVTTQDWEITPQDLDATNFTVSGGSDEATYDGTPKPIVFTSDPELTEGTDYEVYYKVDDTWTTDAPTNAGEYEVKIDIINPDYKDEDIEGFTLTINPAVITVDGLSAADKEYDGTETADASITSFTGVQNSEGTSVINVVVTKAEFKDVNAGEDRIVDVTYALEGTGASNYVLVNTTSETTATITPKEVTLDWGTTTFEYNGSDQTVTATVTNAVGSDVVTVTTYTDNKQADAGDYTAEATGLSNTNYVLPADATQAWSITKKDVDADDYEISISPTNTEYDGTEKKPGITITIGDKTIPASEYIIEYEDNVDAGTATVTIKNAEGGNYTLDTKSGNFTITPRAITLKSASEVFSYDAAEHKKEVVEISSGSLAGTDKFEYSDFTVVKALTTGTDNEFTVTATSGKLTNYDITYIYGKLIVNAVELNADVELSQYEFVYDATAKEPTVTVYDPNGNVIPSSEYSVVYEDNINAGTATATVKIVPSAETGYVFSDITETFEIKQREVALVWSTPTEFTYDGTLKSVTASVDPTSLVSTDECTVTVTDNEATAVNSYTAKAISLSNNNYTLPENATQDWKINSKVVSTEDQQVELSENGSVIDDNTYTYGGDEKKPTVVVKDENGDIVPPEEYTVTYEENTDAGTAKVIITDKEGGNYTVETNEIPFVINQKEVVLDWSDDTDFEYNGETHGISVEVKGLVGDDECEPTVTGNQGTDAGNYTAEVTALSNDNYKLPSTPTQDWTITPMDLSEANFTVKDNTDSTTYNGKPQDIVFTTEPELTEGDDYVVYYKVDDTWTTEAPTNAGEYEVKIDIINPNYNDEDITGFTLVIEPKEVTLSLDDNLFQYDAAEHSVNVLVGGIEEGDVCNPTVTGTTSATNVDKYDVTVTGLDNANYKLPEDVTLSWKIADDIIAKDDQQVTLFDENDDEVDNTTYTYGNDEKKPTVVVKDKNGNVIPATEYTVTYEDNVDAGTAKVIIKDVDGGNYTIEDNEIEFTINKKEIALDWSDETEFTYDGTEKTVTVTTDDIVSGDDCKLVVTGNTGTDVDDYTATVSLEGDSKDNYKLPDNTTQDWTIKSKDLTVDNFEVSNDSDDVIYNGNPQPIQFTTDPELTEGTDYVVYYKEKGSDTWTTDVPTNAGEYDVKIEVISPNYTNGSIEGYTLTIEPKELVLDWDDETEFVYNGKADTVNVVISGIIDGDDCKAVVSGNTGTAVDNYTASVTLEGDDKENYKLPSNSTQDWAIVKNTETPSVVLTEDGDAVVDDTYTYDGTAKEPKIELKDKDGNVIPESEYVVIYEDNTDAGTAIVKIIPSDGSSYDFDEIIVPFPINKADQDAPEVTATGTSAPGEKDGKINGLETTMEISTDGGTTWTKVDDPEIADIINWIISGGDPDVMDADCNLPAGDYQVRYAEDENHNASPATTVTVEEGTGYLDMVDKDSFEVEADGYCPETDGEVNFQVIKGNPTSFRAVIVGVDTINVADATYQSLEENGKFTVYIPFCDAGSYKINVQFRNDAGAESPVYTFDIDVNLSKKYITNIWDDVVSIIDKVDLNQPENMEHRFKAYQWYRDGEEIPGATMPYYNEVGGLQGVYFVDVETLDGRMLRTCSQEWHLIYSSITAKIYPNPVETTGTIELSEDNGNVHSLEITDVYGKIVLNTTFTGASYEVDMQGMIPGNYVAVVDGITVKIIKK